MARGNEGGVDPVYRVSCESVRLGSAVKSAIVCVVFSRGRKMTRQFSSFCAAAVVSAALAVTPALAQVPGGSYLESCGNLRGSGDRLIANCRREDGSWRQTVLYDVGSCRGDISNQNGRLACNRGGLSYGGYRSQPYYPWAPPTGQWQRYGDPYAYGR